MLDTRWDKYEAKILGSDAEPLIVRKTKRVKEAIMEPLVIKKPSPVITRSVAPVITDSQDYEISDGAPSSPQKLSTKKLSPILPAYSVDSRGYLQNP